MYESYLIEMKKNIDIPAIHDDDLEKVLKDLGLFSKIINGEINCLNCGDDITLENLGGLISINQEVKIICDNPECLASEIIKETT